MATYPLNNFELMPASKLKAENTIHDALDIIEDRYWMIVVIVDEKDKICGVASAGDLRKAILNGSSVYASLSSVMNKNPVSIKVGQLRNVKSVNRVLDDLRKRYGSITMLYAMVPVVSEEERVLGLISLESLTSYTSSPEIKAHRRTVLVVGGAGYIGSVLTRILLESGWSVRVLDKLLYSQDSLKGLQDDRFTLIKGDAGNIDDIVTTVENVDAVVYLAELVGDPACSFAPQSTLKTNYLAVTSMAHLCSHLNINRFVYTSSCSVYGASKNLDDLLSEESSVEPISLYARIKALVEQSILSVCNLPNQLFAPTILRLGTVFGHSYRPRFDLVVNTFVKNALQKGIIEVFGGEQWRPNVHVRDVGQAILRVLNAPMEKVRAQVFNVGSNELNYPIGDLAKIAKEVFPEVKIVKKKNVVDDRNYRVSFTKIEKVLGSQGMVGIKEGMMELKKALEQNELADLDAAKYSNFKMLQELKLV